MSAQEVFDRTVHEAVRQAKLQARIDPNFVPPSDDASAIIASRIFGERLIAVGGSSGGGGGLSVEDADTVVAGRVFSARIDPPQFPSATAPHALTFGTHLQASDTSYDTTVAKTIAIDATPTNVAGTVMARDGSGDVAVHGISAASMVATADAVITATITHLGGPGGSAIDVTTPLTMASGKDISLGNNFNGSVLAIVGYVTIKDLGGSVLKLAVVN